MGRAQKGPGSRVLESFSLVIFCSLVVSRCTATEQFTAILFEQILTKPADISLSSERFEEGNQ